MPHADSRKLRILIPGAVALCAVVAVVLYLVHRRGSDAFALARSADPADRGEAVDKLEENGSAAARQTLRTLVRDPDVWVARRAVRTIDDRPTLRRILEDKALPGEVRGEAAVGLAKAKADPKILVAELNPARQSNAAVRAGAARGLGILRDPSAIPQLVRSLEDQDPKVRLWAITAIHKMIVRRFPFRAELPPETQKDIIERIKKYLRRAGAM